MVLPLAIVGLIVIIVYSRMMLTVESESEASLYDQLYSVDKALTSADRDFYQALHAAALYEAEKDTADQAVLDGYKSDFEENAQQTADGVATVESIVAKYPQVGTYQAEGATINAASAQFDKDFKTWQATYSPGSGDYEAMKVAFDTTRDSINVMEDIIEKYASDEKAYLKSSITKRIVTVLIIVLVVYCVIAAFCVYIIGYIRKNIEAVTESIVAISKKDLTAEVTLVDHQDEIGKLSHAAYELSNQQKDMVNLLQDSSATLRDSSGQMADNTRNSSASMANIDTAAGELAHTATQTATDVENISVELSTINNVVGKSVQTTEMLSNECNDIRHITDNGMKTVDDLTDATEQNVKAFESIFEAINGIDERTKQISTASDLITSIASQTNLLSLNASIEAARAGEAGKGFAVVAGEIGALADQSAQSAQTINKMLEELQKSSQYATEQSNLVREYVERQKESVGNTRESFSAIVDSVGKVNDGVSTLNQVNSQLETGMSEITNLLDSLSAASQENAATAQELSATTSSVTANVEELKNSGDIVSDSAHGLANIIEEFKI